MNEGSIELEGIKQS